MALHYNAGHFTAHYLVDTQPCICPLGSRSWVSGKGDTVWCWEIQTTALVFLYSVLCAVKCCKLTPYPPSTVYHLLYTVKGLQWHNIHPLLSAMYCYLYKKYIVTLTFLFLTVLYKVYSVPFIVLYGLCYVQYSSKVYPETFTAYCTLYYTLYWKPNLPRSASSHVCFTILELWNRFSEFQHWGSLKKLLA